MVHIRLPFQGFLKCPELGAKPNSGHPNLIPDSLNYGVSIHFWTQQNHIYFAVPNKQVGLNKCSGMWYFLNFRKRGVKLSYITNAK